MSVNIAESIAPQPAPAVPFKGNDKLLIGIVLAVITFWLFAQTTLNVSPTMRQDLGIDAN